MRHSISNVRFHPADRAHRATGLLGWLSCEINGLVVDGITVRRTRQGQLSVSFPKRREAGGRRRTTVRPRDERARAAIEAQVVAALRRGAHIP